VRRLRATRRIPRRARVRPAHSGRAAGDDTSQVYESAGFCGSG
jgi:hypothetical protein